MLPFPFQFKYYWTDWSPQINLFVQSIAFGCWKKLQGNCTFFSFVWVAFQCDFRSRMRNTLQPFPVVLCLAESKCLSQRSGMTTVRVDGGTRSGKGIQLRSNLIIIKSPVITAKNKMINYGALWSVSTWAVGITMSYSCIHPHRAD